MSDGWVRVVCAGDLPTCDCCEEAWCPAHGMHYADCDCIGPHEDDVEYTRMLGELYARRVAQDSASNARRSADRPADSPSTDGSTVRSM